jgi:hypothetical protein
MKPLSVWIIYTSWAAIPAIEFTVSHADGDVPRFAQLSPPIQGPINEGRTPGEFKSIEQDDRYLKNALSLSGIEKIIDGKKVSPATYKDIVGLAPTSAARVNCTGILVKNNVVLTAKHCACPLFPQFIVVGDDEMSGSRYAVMTAEPRDDKCDEPVTDEDLDLATLILREGLASIPTRELAAPGTIDKAISYKIVGYGWYVPAAGVPATRGEKRETIVPSASNDCDGSPKGWNMTDANAYGCKPKGEIVAGTSGLDRDTCNGDSGGPLLISDTFVGRFSNSERELKLAGVTSRPVTFTNTNNGLKCGDGGVYVRITKSVQDWLGLIFNRYQ